MKRCSKSLIFTLSVFFFAFLGCDTPSNSNSLDSIVREDSATNEIPAADTSGNTDTEAERTSNKDKLKGEVDDDGSVLEKDSLNDFDSFVLGFDASSVDYYEKKDSQKWYDTDGTEKEFFTLLKNHGVNTVRLRIWNDPDNAPEGSDVTGDCNLERLVAMAKRVKSAGLKLMLDFHYSDTWADPGRQIVPYMWKDLTSVEEVANAISEYTAKILRQLKIQADVTPYYVQIGNEINPGLLLHTEINSSGSGSGTFAYGGGNRSENIVTYLKAASKAVRDFNDKIKIMVHVASSNSPETLLNTLKNGSLDYDVIGLSYYPRYESHGTISKLKTRISSWKTTYSKDVVIAEMAFDWNYNVNYGVSNLINAKANLVNPETASVYSDLELDSESNYVLGSVENQKKVLVHITDESKSSGAIGVCTWGGEIRDWEHGMFTWEGKAFDSIDFFNNYSNE